MQHLEELERLRREEDKEEETFRVRNARIFSEGVRTQGPTIRGIFSFLFFSFLLFSSAFSSVL
jgi:hypothetical protein